MSHWSNTIRWLALGGEFQPGEQVALKLSRTSVRLGDPLVIDAAAKIEPAGGFTPTLRLIDPDGVETVVESDPISELSTRRQATVTPGKPGVWRVVMESSPLTPSTIEKRFSVYDVDLERLRTEAKPALLRELAERTGGMYFTADQPVDLPRQLERQLAARVVPPKPVYAWDKGVVLALLLAWMGLEWVGRRQAGWL